MQSTIAVERSVQRDDVAWSWHHVHAPWRCRACMKIELARHCNTDRRCWNTLLQVKIPVKEKKRISLNKVKRRWGCWWLRKTIGPLWAVVKRIQKAFILIHFVTVQKFTVLKFQTRVSGGFSKVYKLYSFFEISSNATAFWFQNFLKSLFNVST